MKQVPVGLLYKLSEIDKNCVLSLEKSIKKSVKGVLEFVSSLSKRPKNLLFGAPRSCHGMGLLQLTPLSLNIGNG